ETLIGCGFKIVGWRDVPINDEALGNSALSVKPAIRQLLIDAVDVPPEKREVRLYIARRQIENTRGGKVYIPSLSTKTIVYKGMLAAPQLHRFYPDLQDDRFDSAFCLFHQRFSTNTFPVWELAQPFRVLAHNGEINTIKGNRNWMSAIEHEIRHEVFEEDNEVIRPLISFGESDSASLDRIIELLVLAGWSPEHSILMCVPPAWEESGFGESAKAFLEFKSLMMKPWDGPAALVLTDGVKVCAHLDRNGLRPLRYTRTESGFLILGSETGMVDMGSERVEEKGRLGPGDVLCVDTSNGSVRHTDEILKELSARKPYRRWLDSRLHRLGEDIRKTVPVQDAAAKQAAFGYTAEEIQTSLKTMAEDGKEMTYSMGDDTPLPPLSEKPQLLFRYFKQRFSQVTNPPIDPIREETVMSLRMALGHKRNFLMETPDHAARLQISSPLLFESQLTAMEDQNPLKMQRIETTYSLKGMEDVLDPVQEEGVMTCCIPGKEPPLLFALRRLRRKVILSVRQKTEIIILSDRDLSGERAAIPSLLAVSASFTALQNEGLGNRASIVIETGEARDVHHFACLIGCGASAVVPYLALHTIRESCKNGTFQVTCEYALANYRKALEEGLRKVMSRLGISTLNSYWGARLFDAVCLNRDFIQEFFRDVPVTLEADGLVEVEQSLLKRHAQGFEGGRPELDFGGNLRHRKGGEWHQWSTSSVAALIRFVRSGDRGLYREFSKMAYGRPVFIRHLLDYRKGKPVPLEEVESPEMILKRFFSGAMSVGALSPEAHETIAEACNFLCIRSNSGEGGEDPARYWTIRNSAIKQIASGRFGVTPAYLASAAELEIKIAQGAKPGEGGHLPANKVTAYIATLRHCSPNTLLISPPPHHDIYSIEDLAQLINDLKAINPGARVCVKLVSESGVGTVAAGVAKSYADIVQLSGCEGGTGASPIGSIKNAGNYWETGLAETQEVLVENGLRDRIRVRVDGGLRTGRDVVTAALLGAEEFGFGTATMIALGCVMARQCHLNTCPTGIATQDERLRRKFRGTADRVVSYFSAVAEEVREILAGIGFRTMEEIIGKSDLLKPAAAGLPEGSGRLKLDAVLGGYREDQTRKCTRQRNDNPSSSMNDRIIEDLLPHVEKAERVSREYEIRNTERSIPLKLNYHIARRYRDRGLPHDTINLTFRGTAGQSFGAFNHKGLSLTLIGEANDYVGKGMFGGRLVIMPSPAERELQDQIIAGNTILYGATGGEFYAAGRAGERFAVRNSGATAVVEGTGHHLCEYMTRGIVVVLGEAGFNIGAGMTGGLIYLLDPGKTLRRRLNSAYVKSLCLEEAQEMEILRSLIQKHHSYTGSRKALVILDNFQTFSQGFRKIVPV
ncbi:MAG: glutamate synthase large subunit, partial [Candidatus Sulfobium sp.]